MQAYFDCYEYLLAWGQCLQTMLKVSYRLYHSHYKLHSEELSTSSHQQHRYLPRKLARLRLPPDNLSCRQDGVVYIFNYLCSPT